jgi:hypothetical protein
MNRPTMLISALCSDLLTQHNLPTSKDLEVIQDRVKREGESFLFLTLPHLGSALETGLERGFLLRSDIGSFGHDKGSMLPRFLGGLWKKIFSRDGRLLQEPDGDAIFAIRQISYFMKKPKQLASESRNRKAIRKFRTVEEELERYTKICKEEFPLLRSVSNILWGNIFYDIHPEILVCRHGPGATAERKSANSRFTITHWNDRSQATFPLDIHGVSSFWEHSDLENVVLLSEEQEIPVRVVQVPKTMKTPRTIAIEPSHVQYMQQGLMQYVVQRIEKHRLTRDSIRFLDQSVNSDRARASSISRRSATLDLSDASDRVHLDLVKNIFKNSPLLPYLLSCRSGTALLPDSKQPLSLRKFASMGSAMCFPVEAMVFYTLIQVALHYYHNEVPTERSIKRFSREIAVYGDDLIIPTYSRAIVEACLQAVGLQVNQSKSFSEGFFRESCGGDFYKGYEVTPVYLRHLPIARFDHSNVEVLASLVATTNQLYKGGLWKTCQVLRDIINAALPRKWTVPLSQYVTSGISYFSLVSTQVTKFSFSLNSWTQKYLQLCPTKCSDPLSSMSSSLLKSLGGKKDQSQLGKPMGSWKENFPLSWVYQGVCSFDSSVKRGSFKVKSRWFNALIGIKVY